MKRIIIIVLISIGIYSCQNKTEPEESISISGIVSPVKEGYISLTFGSVLDSAKISKEGTFTMSINSIESGTGLLLFNNSFTQVYLEPGKSLSLEINTLSKTDNVVFGDELGPINKYLTLARKLDRNTAVSDEVLYSMEPEKFISKTDSIRNLKIQLLKEYVIRYPEIDSSFVKRHKTDIHYTWASQKLLYPGYHAILTSKIADLPEDYHNSYLSEVEINNPGLLSSSVYLQFLEDYLDFKQALYQKENPKISKLWFPESVARFRVIQQEVTDTLVKDYVLLVSMNDHLDNFGTEHLETFLTNFQIHCKNEEYKSLIDLKLEGIKKLDRGQPAPVFTALDPEGNSVSLADYKGSLVYINLWASWSAWSLQEFPYWESLVRKFEERGVKFISVSLDFTKDMNKWKYILKDKNLGGIHLIQDPDSDIWQKQYFIKDLPRFILIDVDGNILSAYAARPSENMESILERLITGE